jgi:hypothetical protein
MDQHQTHVSMMHGGTAAFMAPEIFREGRKGKAADV